jgi:hypothetical protein
MNTKTRINLLSDAEIEELYKGYTFLLSALEIFRSNFRFNIDII